MGVGGLLDCDFAAMVVCGKSTLDNGGLRLDFFCVLADFFSVSADFFLVSADFFLFCTFFFGQLEFQGPMGP